MDSGMLITGAAVAVVAGLLGYGLRLKEMARADRRAAYLKYLQFIDAFPLRIAGLATDEDYLRVGDEVGYRLIEVEGELSLVGSKRVMRAAISLRRLITDEEFGDVHQRFLGGAQRGT